MPESSPAFSKRLPILAALLCYLMLASLTTLTYVNLRSVGHNDGVIIRNHDGAFAVPRNQFMTVSVVGAGSIASRTVQAINVPGMFGEVIASMVTRTWPDSWRPKYFGNDPDGLFVWRGLIFPLYCLPFWWFVGLGIDAFRGTRHLHWTVSLLGTLFAIFFAFIFIGLAVVTVTRDARDITFAVVGLLPWTVLFSIFPVTWIRNFRRRRLLAKTPVSGDAI